MNFFSFCEDEALKVKVNGIGVHRFFAPEDFLLWGLEPKQGNYDGYAQIVDMPIDVFLGLAEPIPDDDEDRHSSLQEFEQDVKDGKSTDWSLPYLILQMNEDYLWKVVGHDGRHRGMLLKHLNYNTMPVLLKMPKAELNEELLPEILWCQNDRSVKREKDFFEFPITEANFRKPYIEVCKGLAKKSDGTIISATVMDETFYGKSCDAPNLKEYLGDEGKSSQGKAPSSCVLAKTNFKKNKVANVAYRKDNTMPAENLKDYLSSHN